MQAMEKLVDERGHVYCAAGQKLQAGRIAVYGMMEGKIEMPLLNYTSKTPAHQSIAEISRILSKAGARQVMHDYDDAGNIVALSFSLEFEGQRIVFRLPSDWRPVHQLLMEARRKNTKIGRFVETEEHARDVSWRIIKDWVEAQMAIIETHMVTTAQVFLPYAVTKDGQTVYEYLASNTHLLLGEGK